MVRSKIDGQYRSQTKTNASHHTHPDTRSWGAALRHAVLQGEAFKKQSLTQERKHSVARIRFPSE